MERKTTYYHDIEVLIASTGSLAQLAEEARLAACPVTEAIPMHIWLDRNMLMNVVQQSARKLSTVLRRKNIPEQIREQLRDECARRKAFVKWLREHQSGALYVNLSPAPTFDERPSLT